MENVSKGGFSQASLRSYRIFTDQHGRRWGADIEKSTMHPCGPWAAKFHAPLMPPPEFIDVTDAAGGEVRIAYDRWIGHLEKRMSDWKNDLRDAARRLYGDKMQAAIKDHDAALYEIVGEPPLSPEPVKQASLGQPWILGLRQPDGSEYPKPAAAEKYFPTPEPEVIEVWGGDYQPEVVRKAEEPEVPDGYPHMYGPGMWYLSPDHKDMVERGEAEAFKGKQVDARQAAVAFVKKHQPVTAVHDTWE